MLDGRYRVATKIATGGTSTVYRGLDTRLDRPVALKVMDSRYAGDQQFLTRFQLEARTRRPAQRPRTRRGLRPGPGRPTPVPGDGTHRGRHAARAADRARPDATACRRRGAAPGAGRAGRRAPRRPGAPRCQTGKRVDLRRGRRQNRRLRIGSGRRGGRNHFHQRHSRHRRLPVPRTGPGRRRQPAQRCLCRGDRGLRAADRADAVFRRLGTVGRIPTFGHRCAGTQHGDRRRSRAIRRAGQTRDGARSRRPLR